MVEWISSWARGIIMTVIIATIIEMILPDGKNKKYVKLVIGIYVLFAVVTPVVSAIKGKDFEFNSEEYTKYFDNTYKVNSNEIAKSNDSSIEKIYEENIKNDIKQKLKNKGYEVEELNVVIKNEENYGYIDKITMKVYKSEKTEQNTINEISVNKIEIGNTTNTEKSSKKKNSYLTNLEISEIKKFLNDTYSIEEKKIKIN